MERCGHKSPAGQVKGQVISLPIHLVGSELVPVQIVIVMAPSVAGDRGIQVRGGAPHARAGEGRHPRRRQRDERAGGAQARRQVGFS